MSIMTGPANKKYDEGWERIWGKRSKAKKETPENTDAPEKAGEKTVRPRAPRPGR
jgi:hypothetical protein